MTHLTRDELVAWRDREPGVDRDRVLTHLGSCRACTAEYAELIRTAPADEPPVQLRAEDFVERGYAVRRTARQPVWSAALGSWKVWSGVLSAAAALILIVTLGGGPRPDGATQMRGAGIELTSPTAAPGQPITLEWSTGLRASRYRVVVTSPVGGEVFRTTTNVKSVTLPQPAVSRLLPGTTYAWTVTALDEDGETVTSASGTFAVAGSSR